MKTLGRLWDGLECCEMKLLEISLPASLSVSPLENPFFPLISGESICHILPVLGSTGDVLARSIAPRVGQGWTNPIRSSSWYVVRSRCLTPARGLRAAPGTVSASGAARLRNPIPGTSRVRVSRSEPGYASGRTGWTGMLCGLSSSLDRFSLTFRVLRIRCSLRLPSASTLLPEDTLFSVVSGTRHAPMVWRTIKISPTPAISAIFCRPRRACLAKKSFQGYTVTLSIRAKIQFFSCHFQHPNFSLILYMA